MKITRESAITLGLFFCLTVVFYVIGYWLIYRLGRATPLMLSVGVAAVVTCLLRKRPLASLGWGWGAWKYQWLSYLLPLGYITIAYLIIWFAGFGGWYNAEFVVEQKEAYNLKDWSDASLIIFHFAMTATISFAMLLPSVVGEEIAWRGFLVPELNKFMSFTGVALTSGCLWALFHWPLMLLGLYSNEVSPLTYQLFFFTLGTVSMAVIMTYIRLKTGSLWTAVIFHMSHNIFLQKVFSPLTVENAKSGWYVDEFGAVLALVITLFAIYYWRKGREQFSDIKV